MDCDWLFLRLDGTKIEVTIDEESVPTPGDGKWHDGIGYVVRHVVTGRTTNHSPFVIATEQQNAQGT